jgi:hypothetical protein
LAGDELKGGGIDGRPRASGTRRRQASGEGRSCGTTAPPHLAAPHHLPQRRPTPTGRASRAAAAPLLPARTSWQAARAPVRRGRHWCWRRTRQEQELVPHHAGELRRQIRGLGGKRSQAGHRKMAVEVHRRRDGTSSQLAGCLEVGYERRRGQGTGSVACEGGWGG